MEPNNPLTSQTLLRAMLVGILAQAFSFFMFPAAFWMPPSDRFVKQYEPLTYAPWTKENNFASQTRHRILGPVICHYLGIHGLPSALIPVVGGLLLMFLTYLVMAKHTNEQWAAWSTFLIATTQAFISSQTWLGYQDAIGAAAVAACMLTRRPLLACIILFIGMLAEERVAAAFPLIVLWHATHEGMFRWRPAILWSVAFFVSIGLWVGYFYYALHHFITTEQLANYNIGGASHRLVIKNIGVLPLAFFESIRGGWLVLGYGVVCLLRVRHWFITACLIIGVAACLLQAGMVADVSRSAAVVWPAILFAIRMIYRTGSEHGLFLLKTAVFFNFLTPCYQVLAGIILTDPPYTYQPYFPLPVSLTRWLLGI